MAVNNLRRMVNLTKDLNVDGDVTADSLNIGQIGGRRNLIINGAMQVAQRGTSQAGITTSDYYTVDRFKIYVFNQGTWTITQEDVTDLPGFSSSLKMLCTTADASPDPGDILYIRTSLEGQDLQHLKKGTSDAESVTLSFWVKSNKTGTYIAELIDQDSSPKRHINKSFTVVSSGAWEYKTLTFAGDTTGALDNDNDAGLAITFWLGSGTNWNSGTLQTSWGDRTDTNRAAGNVNLASDINNYFQITGVQLELGETATPFEHRSYGEELALCQRYYIQTPDFNAQKRLFNDGGSTKALCVHADFPVTMRATPSMTVYGDIADGTQQTLGAQGMSSSTYGFSAFTSVYSGGFVDMNYYIANAEL